ncbi:sigma-70 family RNA polymerase sigma factor [Conexibacter sp. W3-3-2]|uniref:RNA polymerase sigma factor n=1 Tax=Conexibacter sp. W3-3-2 TaxID=2675227 RepID=UPI0012B9DC23|nr:sigma-70 family RNA polymerase sigma factor [Conexibacter sp. W3-3-2]MTD46288.1 sigma-70 family RNA polymerase sigma factor [Conexibacter sp. W3-3-2]
MTAHGIPPQQGDEAQLYRDLSYRLLRAIRACVIAPDSVIEDACSHAWTQLLRCQPRRETVFAWLKQVAIHEAWDLARRERRDLRADLLAEDDELRHDPIDTDLRMRARDALRSLADLPDRQRTYLSLLISGHSYDEIATATGATRRTVDRHLARARTTLRSTAQH